MKIAIIGVGAIGGYVGIRLALAGEDVTFIARGANLEALRNRGIRLVAADGTEQAVPQVKATDDYAAAVAKERAATADQRVFFQLLYNERHAPADQWFDEHGWTAVATPLADYLREVGRPVPGPDVEAGPMVARNRLVRAVKK